MLLSTTPTACILQEQKVKKAARQAKREPVPIGSTARYVPSQTYSSYGHMGTPLHEVSSYASSTHMGSPGYYSPVHPGSGEKGLTQGCQASCIIQGERVGLRLPVPTKEGVCACFV